MTNSLDAFRPYAARTYPDYLLLRCPFHGDRKPSLIVNARGWFNCLACGATGTHRDLEARLTLGGVYQIVQPARGLTPLLPKYEDTEWVNEFLKISYGQAKLYPYMMDYMLTDRGISAYVLNENRVGIYENWFVIPTNHDGAVLRSIPSFEKETSLRFIHLIGQPNSMYRPMNGKLRVDPALFVVFGMIDALYLASLAYEVVTPTAGVLSFDPAWLDDERRTIFILPDEGEEEAAGILASKLGWRGVVYRLHYPTDCKDPNDYYQRGHERLLRLELDNLLRLSSR